MAASAMEAGDNGSAPSSAKSEELQQGTSSSTTPTTITAAEAAAESGGFAPSRSPLEEPRSSDGYLHKFRLFETRSKFYMIGRNKGRTIWRVLTIDRLEPSELNIREDSTVYTDRELQDLLKRIHEGNKSTGGLKFITNCYGIVGFIKFLGPYYMLMITQRKQIGEICGHMVYAITKSAMVPIPNPSVRCNMANSKDENRYKKLLRTVDLTKDFFFSYSYHVMRSLQKNLCDGQTGRVAYKTMFVWNEFLTRGIRGLLKNTLWTVALVYGFFKQAKLSVAGKDFKLTLIARRSRHFAGTRYLKRGVNESGRVANDVETEQIVYEDVPGEPPTHITSVVQNRGSIPLFWSQEASRLNLKPDIILHKKDKEYEATRLHFENLVKRYGNPIIVLNLIKTREKRPRESILRAEFANAIDYINKNLSSENHLRFLHWDLNKHSRSKGTNVLMVLGRVASNALDLTGFFHSQVPLALKSVDALTWSTVKKDESCNQGAFNRGDADTSASGSEEDNPNDGNLVRDRSIDEINGNNGVCLVEPSRSQKGVLRTNCIDCLDRTNVAQYAYGLAALGRQLHVLGLIDHPRIDLDNPLADDLMGFYETMGDTLALQYGGSAAHNKIFSERRGQWKAATQSQEFFRTLQRYYSNAYVDAEKQDAINLFLGHFQPQQGKPALWELDSDQHYNIGRRGFADEDARSFKRSLSDGNILSESRTPSCHRVGHKKLPNSGLADKTHQTAEGKILSESTPEISTCETEVSFSRFTPTMPTRRFFTESEHSYFHDHGIDDSNFLDLDWLSSSGNSYDDELERSALINSPTEILSTEDVINGIASETSPPLSESGSSTRVEREPTQTQLSDDPEQNPNVLKEFSPSFVEWVFHGDALCH